MGVCRFSGLQEVADVRSGEAREEAGEGDAPEGSDSGDQSGRVENR